ncbi:MAG: guanylate kinase [Chloroflexota bacterium]
MTVKERLGMLYILVGPGGVGKNALMRRVLKQVKDLCQLPTATTRDPRADEQQGVQHLFVSVEEFKRMIDAGELLEHQEVHPDKFYGVPRATVEDAIKGNQDLIADIEYKGATILRESYPENTIAIFIAPPSTAALVDRMNDRQDSHVDIRDRLNRMASEMLYAPLCDYILVNSDFEAAVQALTRLVQETSLERDDIGSYLLHNNGHVSLENVILVMSEGRLLVHDGQPMRVPLGHRESPVNMAHHAVAKLLSLPDDIVSQSLIYGRPDDQPPVKFSFDEQDQHYTVTYFFTIEVDDIQAPHGWEWVEVERRST